MNAPAPDPGNTIQRDRLFAIERIAADVAHDLRTPLQSLLINLEVLRRRVQVEARDDALERTDVVEDEVRRIAAILDAFMIVLRPRGEGQTFDVAAAVGRIAPLLDVITRNRRMRFTSHVDEVLVRATEDVFLYALVRAAAAACDAVPPGGTLRISSRSDVEFLDVRIDGDPPDGGDRDRRPIDDAVAGLPAFLTVADGTITVIAGSPSEPSHCLTLRVPRAGRSLTGPSTRV